MKILIAIIGLYFLANLLYAAKSIAGINFDRRGQEQGGHHGNLFPFGDWIYRRIAGKSK